MKTTARRAPPSKSPSAVRYGIAALSGSTALRQRKCTRILTM